MVLRSSSLFIVLLVAGCGGGGGGGAGSGAASPVGMWAGAIHASDGDGLMHLALLDDGTLAARTGTLESWTDYTGAYTETDGAIDGTLSTSGAPTFTLEAQLDGTSLTGGIRVPPSSLTTSTYELELVASSAVGIWKGTYTGMTTHPLLLLAYPDGALQVHDGPDLEASMETGLWEEAAGGFTATYADGEMALAATVSGDSLEGTWGTAPAATSGGTFILTRER